MPEPQVVVDRIRYLLKFKVRTKLSELKEIADQYATLCMETNERLRKCEDLLKKGLRAEAIRHAELPPALPELAATLDIPEMEEWRATCKHYRVSDPPPLFAHIVARLGEEYATENALQELTRSLRRITCLGTLGQRIAILRRIVAADPGAPAWRDDLRPLEEARLKEIAGEAAAAIKREDEVALAEIAKGLCQPGWIVKPDPALIAKVRKAYAALKERSSAGKGSDIAQEVSSAYAAFDAETVGTGLLLWDTLIASGYFKPDPKLAKQIEEARKWYLGERMKNEREEGFRRAVTNLEDAVASRADVERSLHAVERYEREIPAALQAQARTLIESHGLAERRTHRMLMTAIVIGAVILIAGGAWIVQHSIASRRHDDWIARIEKAINEKQHQTAHNLLEEIAGQEPEWSRGPEIGSLRERLERDLERIAGRHKRFEMAMMRLDAVRAEGFPSSSPIAAMVKEARDLAQDDNERSRLNDWQLVLRKHEAGEQETRDDRFRDVIRKVNDILAKADATDPESQPVEFGNLLNEAIRTLGEATAMTGISEEWRTQIPVAENRINALAGALANATERREARQKRMEAVERAMPDLKAYREAMENHVHNDPDSSHAQRFKAILLMMDRYLAAESLALLKIDPDRPMTEDVAKTIDDNLSAFPDNTNVWSDLLRKKRNTLSLREKEADVSRMLNALRGNPIFYDLCSVTLTENMTEQKYYFPRTTFSTEQTPIGTKYLISCYDKNTFMIAREIKFTDKNKPQFERPLAHATYVREMLGRADAVESGGYLTFLLKEIENLQTNTAIEPVIQADLIGKFAASARGLMEPPAPVLGNLIADLKVIDLPAAWMNNDAVTNKDKQSAREKINRLPSLTEVIREATLDDTLAKAALARPVRCVGRTRAGDPPFEIKVDQCVELWVLAVDTAGRPIFRIAAVREGGSWRVIANAMTDIPEGAPIFAPTDNRRTEDILEDLRRDAGIDRQWLGRYDRWPRCWPANGRKLSEK